MKANMSLLLAGLLIVSAVGCSSAPKQEEHSEAALTGQEEISSSIEDTNETTEVAAATDSFSTDSDADKAAKEAFLEPSSTASEYSDSTSLGSGSSGRGH